MSLAQALPYWYPWRFFHFYQNNLHWWVRWTCEINQWASLLHHASIHHHHWNVDCGIQSLLWLLPWTPSQAIWTLDSVTQPNDRVFWQWPHTVCHCHWVQCSGWPLSHCRTVEIQQSEADLTCKHHTPCSQAAGWVELTACPAPHCCRGFAVPQHMPGTSEDNQEGGIGNLQSMKLQRLSLKINCKEPTLIHRFCQGASSAASAGQQS